MAQKPETTFVTGVHRYLPPVKQFYRVKMNNPYVGGIPDWWYSGRTDLWVEYKYLPKLPVRVPVRPYELLSPLQTDWLNGRLLEGRNVRVIVGFSSKWGVILADGEWNDAIDSDKFQSRAITKAELAQFLVSFCSKENQNDQIKPRHLSAHRRSSEES